MNIPDFIGELLKYLGLLAVPSLLWNIYLYSRKSGSEQQNAKRDLRLRDIEFNEMMQRHRTEAEEAQQRCEGEIRTRDNVTVDTFTPEDKAMLIRLGQTQKSELDKLMVEIGHLANLAGETRGYFVRESRWAMLKRLFGITG